MSKRNWRHRMTQIMATDEGADQLAAALGWWFMFRYGLKRHQHVGPWRPDFASHKRKLIIEVEREYEVPKDLLLQSKYFDDQESRDWNLYQKGWSILHWKYKDVIDDPQACALETKRWAKAPKKYRRGG